MLDKNQISECIEMGLTIKEAALLCGTTYQYLADRSRNLGLQFRSGRHLAENQAAKLYEETPLAYYWMGLLLADGTFCFKQNKIRLALTRRETVEGFQKFVGCKNRITTTKFPDRNWRDLHILSFCTKASFSTIVKKFDVRPNKTHNPPKQLPETSEDNLLALLIGIIDGDGHISSVRGNLRITVDCHESWLGFFRMLASQVERPLNYSPQVHLAPRQVGRPSSRFFIGAQLPMMILSNFILAHDLPVMAEKWRL